MIWPILIPLFLGAATVFQSGINRDIGAKFSLPLAVFFNGIILTSLAGVLYLVQSHANNSGGFKTFFGQFSLIYILPGIFGFCVVAGIPFAISKGGATKVFVFLVTAQMLTSLVWDYFSNDSAIGLKQVLGVLFALASVITLSV